MFFFHPNTELVCYFSLWFLHVVNKSALCEGHACKYDCILRFIAVPLRFIAVLLRSIAVLFMLLCIFVCTRVYCSYYVSKVFVLCLCLYYAVFVLCSLCLYYVYVFVLCLSLDNGLLDLDAARLARSQNPEGPATGHLDPGFLGFPGS